MFKLEGLKKPKGLKGLKGLGNKVKATPMPDLDEGPERLQSVVDDELSRLTRTLGDERLAKRVLKLKKKYPDGTLPELVAIDWLERKQVKHQFQFWVLGGREIRGGQVLDIVIDAGTHVIIWEVQGNYWHTRPGNIGRDAAQKFALLAVRIWGKPVKYVVALWERRIMTDVPSRRQQLFEMGMSGVELGP